MKKEWCTETPQHLDSLGWGDEARKKKPKRVKCLKCKKRFLPRLRSCGDLNERGEKCWHLYLPAHKK